MAKWKNGIYCEVSKRLMLILIALGLALLLLLVVAWLDGGRTEPRLIVEPVNVPETDQ